MPALTPIFVNGWKSTVQAGSSAIGSATATGINVATGDGAALGTIGTNQYVPMVVTDSSGVIKEYVWGTAVATDTLTVTRQAEDSTRFAASTTSIQSGYSIYAVASRTGLLTSPPLIGQVTATDRGFITQNLDPTAATTNYGSSPSGQIRVYRVPFPVTRAVTNVHIWVQAAGVTLTSGQNFAGVYNSSGTRLALTADQSTAWASTGLMTMALSGGPVTITGGTGVWVYVATLFNASTVPSVAAATQGAAQNAGLSSGSWVIATAGSGQTSLPASVTFTQVAGLTLPWVALS